MDVKDIFRPRKAPQGVLQASGVGLPRIVVKHDAQVTLWGALWRFSSLKTSPEKSVEKKKQDPQHSAATCSPTRLKLAATVMIGFRRTHAHGMFIHPAKELPGTRLQASGMCLFYIRANEI
jgi:hypothetical protein